MATTTVKGLYVWDLETDQFDHTELEANWQLIDSWLGKAQYAETLPSIPVLGNFAGRLVMLSAPAGGFPIYTLIRYDGSAWRSVGAMEILPAIPTLNNYVGRLIMLSADDGGFLAWDMIQYDGAAWQGVGGFKSVSTGLLASNIQGRETAKDIYISDPTRGIVLIDRVGGIKRRIYFNNGTLTSEVVT